MKRGRERKTNIVNRSVGAIDHRADVGMLYGDGGSFVERRPEALHSTFELTITTKSAKVSRS